MVSQTLPKEIYSDDVSKVGSEVQGFSILDLGLRIADFKKCPWSLVSCRWLKTRPACAFDQLPDPSGQ
jgi:hypothetical protein